MDRPEDAPAAFQAVWNAHDMMALGELFHEDATFVNRFGHYVKGVDAIIALHQPIHETIYRDSALKSELIDASSVDTNTAVLHFWCRLTTGEAHPTGLHHVDTLILAVVTRRNGDWRFQAIENVTLADPLSGQPILRR